MCPCFLFGPPASEQPQASPPGQGPSCHQLILCLLRQPRGHSPGPSCNARLTQLCVFFLLQDPTNLDKFNVSNFFHVKNNMKMTDPGTYSQGWSGCEVLEEIGQCSLCEGPTFLGPESCSGLDRLGIS